MKHIFFFTILFMSLNLYSQSGELDSSFSYDGIVTSDFNGFEGANSIVEQPNGNILMAGWHYTTGLPDFALSRYKTNGDLDSTFGNNGVVITDLQFGSDDQAFKVLLQSNGKIILAGVSKNGMDSDFAIARYLPNGVLDPTFDQDGILTIDLGSDFDQCFAADLQTDGKIVIGGKTSNVYENWVLMRITTTGSLDQTFGTGGKAVIDRPGRYEVCYDLKIQQNGKILTSGTSNNEYCLMRFLANGNLDLSFDSDGIVTTSFSGYAVGKVFVIQPDQKIVMAGWINNGNDNDFGLVRYLSNGSIDLGYGNQGIVTTDVLGYSEWTRGIALQADGKLVLTGSVSSPGNTQVTVIRYNTNGDLDSSFGNNGIVLPNISPIQASDGNSIYIQSDTKILIGGTSNSGFGSDFMLLRFHPSANISIDEKDLLGSSIICYPNPANEILNFQFKKLEPYQFQLIDYSGTVVLNGSINPKRNFIDLIGISSGNYLLQIKTESGMVIETKSIQILR